MPISFYAGTPAITQRKHGRGRVTYCGVAAEPSLYDALIESIAQQCKLDINILPARVQILQRDGYWIALNYQDRPVAIPAPASAKFILGGRQIEPAGVAVWTTD